MKKSYFGRAVLAAVVLVLMFMAANFSSSQANKNLAGTKAYFPAVMAPTPYFGVALAVNDANTNSELYGIGLDWYYDYGPVTGPAGKVPMLWNCATSSQIPANYAGYILLCNEPDRPQSEQGNHHEPVDVRNAYYFANYQNYLNATIVCCNISSGGYSWLAEYYTLGGRAEIWSVHGYVTDQYSVADIESRWTSMHNLTGGDYWITEYGVLSGNVAQFQALTEWMKAQPWIKRIAPYTNRQPHTGQPWELPSGVELFDYQTLQLKPIGAYYQVAVGKQQAP